MYPKRVRTAPRASRVIQLGVHGRSDVILQFCVQLREEVQEAVGQRTRPGARKGFHSHLKLPVLVEDKVCRGRFFLLRVLIREKKLETPARKGKSRQIA